VFQARFHPGIAANPFLTFYTRATRSGTLEFRWTDQNGQSWSETHSLSVE
jgi:sulfur-oxidizing protein SoxZ